MARAAGHRAELNGYPAILIIERDRREEVNITTSYGRFIARYLTQIGGYEKSLEKYPNHKAVNVIWQVNTCARKARSIHSRPTLSCAMG
jgi:hypothetical protein